MLTSRKLLNSFISLGLLLGVVTQPASAVKTPILTPEPGRQFHRIEQSSLLKIGVTLGGLALIGLELWWFQFSQPKTQQAEAPQDID